MFEIELNDGIVFTIDPDEFIMGAFWIRLKRGVDILCQLHIVPLWINQNQFVLGDYYIKTFAAYPSGQGYGSLLMNTLLTYIDQIIPNWNCIYSTSWIALNNFNDTDFITVDVAAFWESLIRQGIAIRDEEHSRFKIVKEALE